MLSSMDIFMFYMNYTYTGMKIKDSRRIVNIILFLTHQKIPSATIFNQNDTLSFKLNGYQTIKL